LPLPAGQLPPGPESSPEQQAIGFGTDPIGFFADVRDGYGDIFTLSFPGLGQLVYLTDSAYVREIFNGDPGLFEAGEATEIALGHALGPNSVFMLDGERHMELRKLLLPMFHIESVRSYGDVIAQISERVVRSWSSGEPFQMYKQTEAITREVILRTVFGVDDLGAIEQAGPIIEEFGRRAKSAAMASLLPTKARRDAAQRGFEQATAQLDGFVYGQIARRRGQSAGRPDVLSLLLEARYDDGGAMSDEEIRDQLVTVIEAGHETTAGALAWTLDCLLHFPEAMGRLRESLSAGEDAYLDATLKEALRMRPVIMALGRRLTAAAEIGGYTIPAGTLVLVGILAIHHRADLYPQPDEFRPERFLGDGSPNPYGWIPFGGGVHRCIGAGFAQFEMRIILRAILEHAELRAVNPDLERPRIHSFTLLSPRGPRVVLEEKPS
jgi:cytochrome P450